LVLAVGLIGSAAALYVGANSDSFRRWLAGELSQRTGYAIGMDNLRLNLPLRLIASGVTAAKDGKRVLSAAKFNVTVTPLDIFAKTIHRVQVEQPVLEIDLAELLKSQPKSETTIALRNLNIVNGRAVIKTEDGNQIEIPAINLDAQNINLGGQTGIALRAEIPPLDGIADVAIERRDSEFSLHAMVNAKPTAGLLGRAVPANAQPIVTADAALRMPPAQEPTIEIDLKFNQLKLGAKEITGQLKTSAALALTDSPTVSVQ
jgi:hypothetical protein